MSILQEASVIKEGNSEEFQNALEYAKQLRQTEIEQVEEMADIRGKRQKSALLEKACLLKLL